jgi:hypothetical protein
VAELAYDPATRKGRRDEPVFLVQSRLSFGLITFRRAIRIEDQPIRLIVRPRIHTILTTARGDEQLVTQLTVTLSPSLTMNYYCNSNVAANGYEKSQNEISYDGV